jgi:archaellum biogenesis ATPase FlaH
LSGSEVIFVDNDKRAYKFILSYYQKHKVIPSTEIFRTSFPESTYPFSSSVIPLTELMDLSLKRMKSYRVAALVNKVLDYRDANDIDGAIEYIQSEISRFNNSSADSSTTYDVASPSFDLDSLLSTELKMGIPFGIPDIDSAFWGFQPGQLITLLGRQKSSKTFCTLNSAYHAWLDGFSILFFSVEMGEKLLHERLLCLGAHVSPSRIRRGTLTSNDQVRVREFQEKLNNGGTNRFVLSKKKTLITVSDIAEEIERNRPDIVYIDGFSFMLDRKTNRMTDDWQANENVAAELKSLAMEKNIAIFVNTQVQEKQYSASAGVQAKNIQGGTGLLKASDLIIGLDRENDNLTLSCQMSRFEDFDDVHVNIDFDTMTFTIYHLDDSLKAKGI